MKTAAVDAYIAKAKPFAQPILKKLRKLFHQGCPQIEEKIKWSFPSFEHKGMLGGFAAFKEHVDFGFWKGKLLEDRTGYFAKRDTDSLLGMKLKDVSELPPDKVLLDLIRQAAELNEKGVKLPPRKPKPKIKLVIPPDLASAMGKNKKASATYEGFSYSKRKEYLEWITEAKRPETRAQRVATAVEWMAQGKGRHWKYENC